MPDRELDLHIGREEIVVVRRWETASIANDVLVALWFIAGSVLFLSPRTTELGTWFFLAGSIELLIRPLIRLARNVHVGRIRADAAPVGD